MVCNVWNKACHKIHVSFIVELTPSEDIMLEDQGADVASKLFLSSQKLAVLRTQFLASNDDNKMIFMKNDAYYLELFY